MSHNRNGVARRGVLAANRGRYRPRPGGYHGSWWVNYPSCRAHMVRRVVRRQVREFTVWAKLPGRAPVAVSSPYDIIAALELRPMYASDAEIRAVIGEQYTPADAPRRPIGEELGK